MFYSDTLNVALPSDTVSNVIHLTYNIMMDPQQIPDSIFDIDMSSVKVNIPSFGGLGDSIQIPSIDPFSREIPILENIDTGTGDCFIRDLALAIEIPEFSESIPTNNFPIGNICYAYLRLISAFYNIFR